MSTRPTCFINANLPLDLVERIKAAARKKAVQDCRHVPYVHVLREALEQAFPAINEDVREDAMKQ